MSAPLDMETVFEHFAKRGYVGLLENPEVEVTSEVYDHFLNILPPGDAPGVDFYVIERITGDVVNAFTRRGDRYFMRCIEAPDRTAALKANPGCCEEASTASRATYIPCNRPARYMVGWPRRREGPYRMCEPCASHNVANRGAQIIEAIKPAGRDPLKGDGLLHFNDHFGLGQGGAD